MKKTKTKKPAAKKKVTYSPKVSELLEMGIPFLPALKLPDGHSWAFHARNVLKDLLA